MVRKRKRARNPDAYKNVGVHPELHRLLDHRRIDEGLTLRESLHEILCRVFDRPELSLRADEPAVAASR